MKIIKNKLSKVHDDLELMSGQGGSNDSDNNRDSHNSSED
jgi:hypothetical protein